MDCNPAVVTEHDLENRVSSIKKIVQVHFNAAIITGQRSIRFDF
jgi:hypothetical protein